MQCTVCRSRRRQEVGERGGNNCGESKAGSKSGLTALTLTLNSAAICISKSLGQGHEGVYYRRLSAIYL